MTMHSWWTTCCVTTCLRGTGSIASSTIAELVRGSWLTWAGNGHGLQYLPLDAIQTADEIVVRVLTPGVDPEAIDVTYQHGTLTIRVKMEAPELPEGGAWLMQEIGRGQAVRQITLPRTVYFKSTGSTTRFENGVLADDTAQDGGREAEADPGNFDAGDRRGHGELSNHLDTGDGDGVDTMAVAARLTGMHPQTPPEDRAGWLGVSVPSGWQSASVL